MITVDNEITALATVSNALELGCGVLQSVVGDEISDNLFAQEGASGIASILIARIKLNHEKQSGA